MVDVHIIIIFIKVIKSLFSVYSNFIIIVLILVMSGDLSLGISLNAPFNGI